jgi:hypothetical protein
MQSSQWIGKNLPRPRNAWKARSNVEVMLTVAFGHRGCCASWILMSGANSELLVLPRSAETSKRKCQEKKTSVVNKQLLVPPSWQCTSSCIATDLPLLGQHERNCASSATLLTWLCSGRLFLISQTEIHFERITISDDSRDYRKYTDGTMRNPDKGVPGLFPEVATALRVVHQCRRGVLWRQ